LTRSAQRLLSVLDRFEEVGTTAFLSVAVVVTFIEVIKRYVFGGSLGWANEVTIICVIWGTLIGASLGVREGIHIGVDVVVARMPPRLGRLVTVFALLASAAWVLAVGAWGTEFVAFLTRTNRLTSELQIPAWIPNFIVPASAFMMGFRFIQAAIRYWNTPPEVVQATRESAAVAAAEEVPV